MIFLVGSSRSGTTWLAKLFDSHPQVLYRHEPDSIVFDNSIPYQPNPDEIEPLADKAGNYLKVMSNTRYPKNSGQRPFFNKTYRGRIGNYLFPITIYGVKVLEQAFPYFRKKINRFKIPDLVSSSAKQSPIYVFKSVDSLERTKLFSRADPELKSVHIVRHPGGYVSSRIRGYKMKLMDDTVFIDDVFRMAESANYPFSKDQIINATFEEKLTFEWMVKNDRVMAEMSKNPNYMVINYESLCLNPMKHTKQLFEFTNLEWNQQTEEFISKLVNIDSNDAGYFQIIRSPEKAAFKWRNELSDESKMRIHEVFKHSNLYKCGVFDVAYPDMKPQG